MASVNKQIAKLKAKLKRTLDDNVWLRTEQRRLRALCEISDSATHKAREERDAARMETDDAVMRAKAEAYDVIAVLVKNAEE